MLQLSEIECPMLSGQQGTSNVVFSLPLTQNDGTTPPESTRPWSARILPAGVPDQAHYEDCRATKDDAGDGVAR